MLTDNGVNVTAPVGTLRAAVYKRNLDAGGAVIPRIVVFHVSGEITLKAQLTFYQGRIGRGPDRAVRGHLGPGSSGGGGDGNVLVQHLRIRPGDEWLRIGHEVRDALKVGHSTLVGNVVFDHLHVAWMLDKDDQPLGQLGQRDLLLPVRGAAAARSVWTRTSSPGIRRCRARKPDAPGLTNMTTSVPTVDDERLVEASASCSPCNNSAADFVMNMLAEPNNKNRTDLHIDRGGHHRSQSRPVPRRGAPRRT